MLNILFFGQLKERLQTHGMQQLLQEIYCVADLRKRLQLKGDIWQEQLALGKTLVAVNQKMASEEERLKDGDEIAFFPPVTGG